jgi:protein TonB
MPRLRTTTGLSLLLLLGGIAGTGWLSTLTVGWSGPAVSHQRFARVREPAHRRMHGPAPAVQTHRLQPVTSGDDDAQASALAPPPLVPLATPADTSQPWYRLRGHLDGRVVVHVDTDARGRVDRASLVESSGDPVLDEHALRSVRGWRFAVPGDQAAGVSGELPMSFSSREDRFAHAP